MRWRFGWSRRAVWVAMVAAIWCVPSLTRGDVVTLKDGSTIRGRVVTLVGDTLTLRTGFGADLRIARAKIERVSFTDSLGLAGMGGAGKPVKDRKTAAGIGTQTGVGRIAVTFVDRRISSKIAVERRRDAASRLHANWIEQSLVVDDSVVYARVDTTMDKTIYNGPKRVYKNTIELEDFEVEVPVGLHHASLVVRNVGMDEHRDAFERDPLNLVLALDNLQVFDGKTVRVKVGLTRGRLRMGGARLIRLE